MKVYYSAMTMLDNKNRANTIEKMTRKVWASALAWGCFIAMVGVFILGLGMLTATAMLTSIGTAIILLGAMFALFGGFVYFYMHD